MKKIVLFASGNGSNVENILHYFATNSTIYVDAIFCNNPNAKVVEIAKNHQKNCILFNKMELNNGFVANILKEYAPSLIVLAGFLLQFPKEITEQYPKKIINIHPALLPLYGGKGMYGMHVHKAVLANKEKESGITIHYVNENYDEGAIIRQEKVTIENCSSPEEIATKIQALEHTFFAKTIEILLENTK